MKRVFKIGEVVWYNADHGQGWGKVSLINRSDSFKDYPCADASGDILTITKEGGKGEIECVPSYVYQVAPDKTFLGETVVYEHHEEVAYPLCCPAKNKNVYYYELD